MSSSPVHGDAAPAAWPMFAALLAVGAIAPLFVYPTFVMKVLCFGLFACAFNLLLGYAGLLSFGHAAFFGTAAYVCGYVCKALGWPPEAGLLAGTVSATALGALFGALAIRRSGIYFAMITLALAQLVYFLAVQLPFTHGEDGLQGIPRGRLFGLVELNDTLSMYYVVLTVFLAGFWVVYRAVHSPFGEVLEAIRANEPRAVSLGYRVEAHKLLAFTLSAGIAGLAGALKAIVFQLASLSDVHWHTSGEVVLMTLLGGLGTIAGPLVGAFTVVTLQNELADKVGSWVTFIMGAIFVACVLVFRRGMAGAFSTLLARRRRS